MVFQIFRVLFCDIILTICGVFCIFGQLDYAARMKKIDSATKSYDETVELLKDVFAKA